MATITAPGLEAPDGRLVAPRWHTFSLVALFLALAFAGALLQARARSHPGVTQAHPVVAPLYLSLIAAEWGLVLFVWKRGLRQTGTALRDLIGGRWSTWTDIVRDVVLAAGVWGAWCVLAAGWTRLLGPGRAASIQPLLPEGALEVLAWLALSVSAGVCEEIVFRGYFLRQFGALTHSRWIGLGLQAALFGVAHGYQGFEACARIAVYGALFGLLALWRGSLRPGMIAHTWTDIAAGLLGI